jgi:hypothetical protein
MVLLQADPELQVDLKDKWRNLVRMGVVEDVPSSPGRVAGGGLDAGGAKAEPGGEGEPDAGKTEHVAEPGRAEPGEGEGGDGSLEPLAAAQGEKLDSEQVPPKGIV